MRSYLLIALGAGFAAAAAGQASAEVPAAGGFQFAQNTGAVNRSLGNGSMGTGEAIERLPERSGEEPKLSQQPARQAEEQSSHGDTNPDMEHHPRRTLGDRDQDRSSQ